MAAESLDRKKLKRMLGWTIAIVVVLSLGGGLLYAHIFGPADPYAAGTQFLVSPDENIPEVASRLKQEGYVHSALALEFAFVNKDKKHQGVRPGGYTLSKSMDTWTLATTLAEPPYLAWVTFPPSLRKEQMADILQKTLFWTDAQKQEWLTIDTAPASGLAEGVYYADVYLIPSDQSPAQVAARMRGRFTDQTAALAKAAAAKHLKWSDVITLASIVEREAAKNDKPLVAGILLNRLHSGMMLQADATLQYVKGTEGNWWPTPHSEDKYLASPFNTYKHTGLPPHPIANPGLDSIAAVINPQSTNCIFYLHDTNHVIHCSANYSGQQQNVSRYLK